MTQRLSRPAVRLLGLHLTGLLALLGGLGTLGNHPVPPLALPGAMPRNGLTGAPGASTQPDVLLRQTQDVVVLGDSVPAATACDCEGFAVDLARSVEPSRLTNAAQSGLTSQGLLVQLSSPAVMRALGQATVVTVTIGANDFDTSLADEDWCSDASCYAPTLRALSATMAQITDRLAVLTRPETKVVVTGYWNVFLDGQVAARLGRTYVATSDVLTRQVNVVLAGAAAQARNHFADLYSPFKGDGSRDDTRLLSPDGDHPNGAGHQLIATVIAAAADLVTLQ